MKLLIDMNLSPDWVPFLQGAGIEVVHWCSVGAANAPDATIMSWARANGCVIFTHDLDFSALLALTRANGPSVVQIRMQDILPAVAGPFVVQIVRQHEAQILAGAILSIEPNASRVRILPLAREPG